MKNTIAVAIVLAIGAVSPAAAQTGRKGFCAGEPNFRECVNADRGAKSVVIIPMPTPLVLNWPSTRARKNSGSGKGASLEIAPEGRFSFHAQPRAQKLANCVGKGARPATAWQSSRPSAKAPQSPRGLRRFS
jgi:hypothetical protein